MVRFDVPASTLSAIVRVPAERSLPLASSVPLETVKAPATLRAVPSRKVAGPGAP